MEGQFQDDKYGGVQAKAQFWVGLPKSWPTFVARFAPKLPSFLIVMPERYAKITVCYWSARSNLLSLCLPEGEFTKCKVHESPWLIKVSYDPTHGIRCHVLYSPEVYRVAALVAKFTTSAHAGTILSIKDSGGRCA